MGQVFPCTRVSSNDAKKKRWESQYAVYKIVFSSVEDVTAEEVLQRLPEAEGGAPQLHFVDVRTPAEQAVSRLPHAATQAEFDAKVARGGVPPDSTVVAYCTIGYRSGQWVKGAVKAGRYPGLNLRNLKGSLLAWTHARGPLVDAAGNPTSNVHVYGRTWDLSHNDYKSVW